MGTKTSCEAMANYTLSEADSAATGPVEVTFMRDFGEEWSAVLKG